MSTCTDAGYPYGRQGSDAGTPESYPFGECTDLIFRWYDAQGVQIARAMGDAHEWISSARLQNYQLYDHLPGSNVIACWSTSYPPFGHVAVVVDTNADGSFVVREWNFCYSVDTDPGHADQRTVSSSDPQPDGFILPTGAGLGQGTPSSGSDASSLFSPLQGIATAIDHVGLEFEAAALTARQKLMSGAQIGVGAALGLGGVGILGLSALGHSPTRMASRAARTARGHAVRVRRQVRPHFPDSAPAEVASPAVKPFRVSGARATRMLRR